MNSLSSRATWYGPAVISMLAFAANSIFCRLALIKGSIDPESFTAIRLLSGAVFLYGLVHWRAASKSVGGSWRGAVALFVYAYLFSIAYVQMGAGMGALILFGAVQLTMFLIGWRRGERVQARVVLGMLIAFAGLIVLLLPGTDSPPGISAGFMVVSGVAWGVYSVIGKGSVNPLGDTAGNFVRCLPLLLLLLLTGFIRNHWHASTEGVLYALASGVLASGAGYAIWYGVVRQVSAQQAATLQLSVPVIAALGGVLLLGEPLSLRLTMTSLVVLGGIAVALVPISPRTKKTA